MSTPGSHEISKFLITKLAEILEIQPEQINPNRSFSSYGLTSIAAVSLTGDLEDWLNRPLTSNLAFEYPTVESLSKFLATNFKSKE